MSSGGAPHQGQDSHWREVVSELLDFDCAYARYCLNNPRRRITGFTLTAPFEQGEVTDSGETEQGLATTPVCT